MSATTIVARIVRARLALEVEMRKEMLLTFAELHVKERERRTPRAGNRKQRRADEADERKGKRR